MLIRRKTYENEINGLRSKMSQIQHSLRITTDDAIRNTQSNAGNPYASYQLQISQLNKMYEGTAEWGSSLMQVLVDIRASYIIGDGIQGIYDKKKGGEKEKAVIDQFMAANKIDKAQIYNLAKSAQIEGRRLAKLTALPDGSTIFQWIPYTVNNYTILTNPKNYLEITGAEYHVGGTGDFVSLSPGEMAYQTFGGQPQYVNTARPHLGTLIQNVENVHKASFDIRKGNAYFGFPTPYFETEVGRDAQSLYDSLVALKWRVGQFLTGTAKMYMVSSDLSGIDALIKEITNNIQLISARSGVPVHRLGFPDVVNARATADDSASGSEDVILSDRLAEMNFWTIVFDRVIANKAAFPGNGNLKTGLVKAEVAGTSTTKIQMVRDVFLKLYELNALSLETLLEKVPGIDVETERQRLAAEHAAKLKLEQEQAQTQIQSQQVLQPKPELKVM